MTLVEVLKLALRKEMESVKLYTRLSQEHSAVKDTLLFLVNEEEKHQKLIEEKISELAKY
jgi:rubrerythrin